MKPLLRLLPYLKRHRRLLVIGAIAVVCSNLFTVVQPLLIGRAIDVLNAVLLKSSGATESLVLYAAAVVGSSVIAGIFSFLTRQTLIVASRHIEFDLRNDFLSHIQKLSL